MFMHVVICCFVCSDEMIVDATSNPDLGTRSDI